MLRGTFINNNTIKDRSLSTVPQGANIINIRQYSKNKQKSKPYNFYKYDPTRSTIITKNGEVKISELMPKESKIEISGTELTFIGLVSKKIYDETFYAIVLNPSSSVNLNVNLVGGDTTDIILSQPYRMNSYVQSEIKAIYGENFLDNL